MKTLKQPVTDIKEIKKLIPHREPMIMVEALLFADENGCRTELTVDEKNLFVKDESFQESGIVEHIAQSCALQTGFLNHDENAQPKIGFLAAVNSFEISRLPKIGEIIATKTTTQFSSASMQKINAECKIESEIIAKAVMTLVIENP